MEILEKVAAWLESFPLWDGEKLTIDSIGPAPGSLGMFPMGVEEISRREDVLGNLETVNRLTLKLCRVSNGNSALAAHWLLALQDWVNRKNAAGQLPRIGDFPGRTRIQAKQGQLTAPAQTGTGRYALIITVEYVTTANEISI